MPEQIEKNEAQERAIKTVEGQVLLISCPGSGKTTTMLRRINHMIKTGIPAGQILMVTFTDAAALEMKERFIKQYGSSSVTFSTIHSLCLKVMSDHMTSLPRIVSGEEQYSLLKDALVGIRIPAWNSKKDVLSDISALKNSGKPIDSFSPSCLRADAFKKVFDAYECEKERRAYVDFDDLLLICKKLLSENSKLLEKYRKKYRYIMVDEYQDTNGIQKDIIYLLAGPDGNLCVVGDDDQSIYGFRGANPNIMLGFEHDYPSCEKIDMSINYRSRPEIINSARDLIENNKQRFRKDIRPFRDGHGTIIYNSANDRTGEIDFLASEVERITLDNVSLSSMAILARTNMQMEEIAAALEKKNIPYRSGDVIADIYESFIFGDILAYLRLINGDGNTRDLVRIINRPNRYIQESSIHTLVSDAMGTIFALSDSGFTTRGHCDDERKIFYQQIITLRETGSLAAQVDGILNTIGYKRFLNDYAKRTDIPESVLLGKILYYLKDLDTHQFSDYRQWERHASHHIMMHKSALRAKDKNALTLSTMHRSKGLEWDVVFLVDCCSGITPITKANSIEAIEEERRLFYVAATRARETLYVLNYKTKSGSGKENAIVKPSIFIEELQGKLQRERMKQVQAVKKHSENIEKVTSEFEDGEPKRFRPGMSVRHKTLGDGVVVTKNLFFVNIRFGDQIKMFPIK